MGARCCVSRRMFHRGKGQGLVLGIPRSSKNFIVIVVWILGGVENWSNKHKIMKFTECFVQHLQVVQDVSSTESSLNNDVFPRKSWSFQVVAGWHISFHPEISALPSFNQTAKIPDSSHLLHLCKLSKKSHTYRSWSQYIEILVLHSWFSRPFGETFPLRHRLWSALCLLIGSDHGWGRQVLRMRGRSEWATLVAVNSGELKGEKRWPKKSPHFHGVIRPGGLLFFQKKQAFWRKWWLDTLVEHKNNHAIGWLVFWKGKREISQLFASSVIFDHPFPDADCGSGMFTALQTMPRAYCAFLQLPNRWSS